MSEALTEVSAEIATSLVESLPCVGFVIVVLGHDAGPTGNIEVSASLRHGDAHSPQGEAALEALGERIAMAVKRECEAHAADNGNRTTSHIKRNGVTLGKGGQS